MTRTAELLRGTFAGVALLGVVLVACDAPPVAPDAAMEVEGTSAEISGAVAASGHAGATSSAGINRDLALLRRTTAPYHEFSKAGDAEYTVLVAHPETQAECLAHPTLGGMGLHYLNPGFVGEEVVVEEPQVLVYEPHPDGGLRFVAVEYLIPFAILGDDAAPPVLFGQEFSRNYTFDLWALHVWVGKHNPSGMFADWNPRVSCGD